MSDADKGSEKRKAEPSGTPPARSAFELPEGWFAVLLLVLVAALCSGLIAAYWPTLMGEAGADDSANRISVLETRVGQIATGNAGAAAAGTFEDLRRDLSAIQERISAAEARLSALEKSPSIPGGAPVASDSAAVAALRQQLDVTTSSLNELTARVGNIPASSDINAKLAQLEGNIARATGVEEGRIAGFESRLAGVETKLPPDDINDRVARLEKESAPALLRQAATLLALAEVSRAAQENRPFSLELKTLSDAEPSDPSLGALQAIAQSGAPTFAMLATRFPNLAGGALDAEREATAQGFLGRLWVNIKSLVTIRRVGNISGDDNGARLARAQSALDAGNLAGAVMEVAALDGAPARLMAKWRNDAEARLTLDREVSTMNARILGSLTSTAAQPAPAANPATDPAAKPSATP